jgi:hypothetical protein
MRFSRVLHGHAILSPYPGEHPHDSLQRSNIKSTHRLKLGRPRLEQAQPLEPRWQLYKVAESNSSSGGSKASDESFPDFEKLDVVFLAFIHFALIAETLRVSTRHFLDRS